MKQVVIVGGGFAGVRVARRLRKHKDISVTLINDSSDFRYSPALYRAATGYKMGVARLPLEWMLLDCANTDLVIGKAAKISRTEKYISLENGNKFNYDYAVLALGSVTSFFNIKGLLEHSFGVKSPDEVTKLRQHLHDMVAKGGASEQNFVIVGGGPTGVEMAGALGSYLKRIARRHKVRKHNTKIWLVEAAPRILPMMHPRASRKVQKRLEKLGIKIALETRVEGESLKSLKTSAGRIDTNTVIWTAGTMINPFYQENNKEFTFTDHHKIAIDEHLQARPNVYVVGDNAATVYSGTALTAVRHGKFAAKDIVARVHKKRRPDSFEEPPAYVVPVGKNWAILQYRSFTFAGRAVTLLRALADYVGYSDVLGYLKALTIWAHADVEEDGCQVCLKSSSK